MLDAFSAEQKEQFAADPHQLWAWILQHISSNDDREYGSLTTTPNALLKVGYGSHNSKKVLFTAICRTIGVPARINPETHAVQFYRDGSFHNVEQSEQGNVLPFTLLSGDDTKWVYFQNWSLALLRDGVYTTLNLSEREWKDGRLDCELTPGDYRLITAKRMPNGSLFAKEYRFTVAQDKPQQLTIRLRDTRISDMLENMDILPFSLQDENGGKIAAQQLTEGRSNILFWLEEGKEPTEHILNELIEHHERYNALDAQLIFILRSQQAKQPHPCPRTRAAAEGDHLLRRLPRQRFLSGKKDVCRPGQAAADHRHQTRTQRHLCNQRLQRWYGRPAHQDSFRIISRYICSQAIWFGSFLSSVLPSVNQDWLLPGNVLPDGVASLDDQRPSFLRFSQQPPLHLIFRVLCFPLFQLLHGKIFCLLFAQSNGLRLHPNRLPDG